jgi:hypothetical protein
MQMFNKIYRFITGPCFVEVIDLLLNVMVVKLMTYRFGFIATMSTLNTKATQGHLSPLVNFIIICTFYVSALRPALSFF